ncbi:thrombospondin, type I, domain containing 7Ab isoform X2 [Hippocampus comes]|uniref:thrombospondin, type I, domain containing 7Ab isoform X2 n=1 Tax=Hippocampus comes TaxID=109280 RepID=UPI00094F1677|nr:PREDICTED: thrombospondin type-1 domain-containing protein 7A-like isoform X2 [Hippocampus comes]
MGRRRGSWHLLVPLLLLLGCVFRRDLAQTDDGGKSVYFWETGPWGRCMGSDCGPGGSQSRAVWCAHVDGWTTLHTNCDQSLRPSNQRNCFRVCDWHKDLYDWRLGPWNSCVSVSSRASGAPRPIICSGGEEGIQTREVGCTLKSDGSPAEDAICEYFEPQPRLEQACLIPCPQDCVVSDYSPWTSCSKTCGTGLRNRVRSVLVPPLFGGSICPNLTEFQSCKVGPCAGPEGMYSLRVGAWTPCVLPQTRTTRQAKRRKGKGQGGGGAKDPETRELIQKKRIRNRLNRQESSSWDVQVGYQTRDVTCVHRNSSSVPRNLCTPREVPLTIQSCVLPRDCQLSDWSNWSACTKACVDSDLPGSWRQRHREVLQFPTGEGTECPTLNEREPCEPQGDVVMPCAVYAWRTTEWSDCRVDLLLGQQDRRRANLTGLCGGGLQTREIYCVQANAELLKYVSDFQEKDKAGQTQGQQKPSVPPLLSVSFHITATRPVENRLCGGSVPDRSQLCQLTCPVECQVSPWGAWGPCTFESCDEQSAKKGFKLRRRQITNEPTGGPANCPHLVEALPCDQPSCYNWRPVGLDRCVPVEQKRCGPGTQLARVQCVNRNSEPVDESLCSSTPPPDPVACQVPCSRDCVLSDWTPWSTCSQTCSSKTVEGKQMRTRSILAYNAGEGGAMCPNSSSLQEVRNCNEHACTVYHWQTGPWGPCSEDPSSATLNATSAGAAVGLGSCSNGVQTRKVMCVRVNVGQVPPKKCPDAPRPSTVRPCQLPCKKDCIMTPFSEWTSCPDACDAAGNAMKTKQYRKRLVIQAPSNGGQDCPEVLEEDRECQPPQTCPGFRWKSHKWRKCQLVPWFLRQDRPGAQENCGPGLQTRAVSCRQLDGTQVDVGECLQLARSMPALTQRCQLPCQDDCQLTNWSKFSSCSADCVGVRTRKRALIGRSKKKDKCKNTQMYPLSETQYCPCDKYNAQPVGNWSDCILPEGGRSESALGLKVTGDVRECGQGYRYQAMVCYDQDGRLVETARCNSHGYIEEACIIPCPSDCKLSEWSNWSRCSKSCGSGVKVRSKWLREKPYNGGRPCPKLDHVNQAQVYEVVPCQSDCNQYVWVAEPWSMWKVSNVDLKENCGEGVQTRKVRCMLNTIDGPSEAVEDYLCDPEEMPLGARESRLPCPEDCVLNDWGPWTRCTLPCTRSNGRIRTAYTLRSPSAGRLCPDTIEEEPCSLNLNCFNYFYNITDWSTCQLSPNAVCGQGIKTRMLDCVRSDGKSVDIKFCEELDLEKKWQMNISCVVECPVNCQLSEWSTWSECSQTCGLEGKMWRQRSVVQASQGDGRPCSSPMVQWKPCPVRPCYRWQYSAWSECRVESVVCGHGTRYRNLTCFVSDGSGGEQDSGGQVDEELCGSLELSVDGDKRIRLKEACMLPCPGECYLMEWSDWSSCVRICAKEAGVDFGSVRVRSRAVLAQEPENLQLCPDQAWESQPCTEGECFEYKWLSSLRLNSSRPFIWCQRSDGLNVTGGCLPATPVMDDSACNPPCVPPTSYCSEAGVCMCEEGYTEVLSSGGLLDQCAPIPILEIPTAGDKKGDVKTSRAVNPTLTSTTQPGRSGRTWYLQPYGPDGKMKIWVYGVAAGAFVLLIFIVSMIYLACSYCAKVHRSLASQECHANGAAVWTGQQNAHGMVYTCPDCQELAQSSGS